MSEIEVRSADAITHIRLNRPEKKNALTVAMYSDLADALEGAALNPAIRIVTIAGTRDAFSAGNDLSDFLSRPPSGGDAPVLRFIRAAAEFPKILVAGVSGPAVGIGTTLLLHCDFVVATPSAHFVMPFVALGVVPEAGSSLLLPRLIGRQLAAKHLLLGEPFDADTAVRYGLVSAIVDEAALETSLQSLADRLAAQPPEALLITKALLAAEPEPVAARVEKEGRLFAERLVSQEAMQAFAAFLSRGSDRPKPRHGDEE